jgi:hypothetical protein
MAVQLERKPIKDLSFSSGMKHTVSSDYHHEQAPRVQKRRRTEEVDYLQETVTFPEAASKKQKVLLLHAPKEKYTLSEEYSVPELKNEHELLIKVQYIGYGYRSPFQIKFTNHF